MGSQRASANLAAREATNGDDHFAGVSLRICALDASGSRCQQQNGMPVLRPFFFVFFLSRPFLVPFGVFFRLGPRDGTQPWCTSALALAFA